MPCRRLLPGDLIRVYHQVLLVSMLLLNSVSVLVNCFVSDSTKSYLSTVVSVILTHMLFLLYLCAIWIADIHFKETFLLKEELWRSSVGCLGAFHLVFWFSIQIQLALIFLSLSRLMVVIHPLDTRFKRTKFAVNAISIVCTMSFCFCILTTLIAQFSIVALPNVLCLPFNDPTQSEVITRTMTYSVSATQSATSIAIVVMHCLLVKYFHESQHNIQRSWDNNSIAVLIAQLVTMSTSNVLCWFPANTIFITTMFVSSYPPVLVTWTTVGVLPLNSLINPAVFLGTSVNKHVKSRSLLQSKWCSQIHQKKTKLHWLKISCRWSLRIFLHEPRQAEKAKVGTVRSLLYTYTLGVLQNSAPSANIHTQTQNRILLDWNKVNQVQKKCTRMVGEVSDMLFWSRSKELKKLAIFHCVCGSCNRYHVQGSSCKAEGPWGIKWIVGLNCYVMLTMHNVWMSLYFSTLVSN